MICSYVAILLRPGFHGNPTETVAMADFLLFSWREFFSQKFNQFRQRKSLVSNGSPHFLTPPLVPRAGKRHSRRILPLPTPVQC